MVEGGRHDGPQDSVWRLSATRNWGQTRVLWRARPSLSSVGMGGSLMRSTLRWVISVEVWWLITRDQLYLMDLTPGQITLRGARVCSPPLFTCVQAPCSRICNVFIALTCTSPSPGGGFGRGARLSPTCRDPLAGALGKHTKKGGCAKSMKKGRTAQAAHGYLLR